MPERIKLKRVKGWKMPDNTVKVDRSTKWGNPYKIGEKAIIGNKIYRIDNNRDAVEAFRRLLRKSPELKGEARKELSGKNLACWCKLDEPCHADVLLEHANS